MRHCILFFALVGLSYNTVSAQEVGMQIVSSTTVHFFVTDSIGRRTGVDPRGAQSDAEWIWQREIPGSHYSYETVGNLDSLGSVTYSMQFLYSFNSPDGDGSYSVDVVGRRLDEFDLSVSITGFDSVRTQSVSFLLKDVPIDKDSTVRFLVTYHGNPGSPAGLLKLISARSLVQDVTVMRRMQWIATTDAAEKYPGLIDGYDNSIRQNDLGGAVIFLETILQNIVGDSATSLTASACNSLRSDITCLLRQLPVLANGLIGKLIDSNGLMLTAGSLQYYDGIWKDAINNNDGTFRVNTTLSAVSLRMTSEGGSQMRTNVPVGPDTVVFQTVNAQVRLQDSQGAPIDTGTVQYYAGSWRTLGTTSNGNAAKELLPGNYSFRMAYAYGSNDKQQDIGTDPVVVFQTVPATVRLQNSQGALIDQGTVQFYAGAWRSFGTTSGGVVAKELLPNNYSFRMTYAYGSNDRQQNIGSDPNVVFTTVNAAVQLKNSQGALIDEGAVQYYAGAWRSFGTTSGGVAMRELLPNNYSFRMTYAYGSNDKQQNVGLDPTVVFSTVKATVELRNSAGSLMPSPSGDQATVQYYAGAWRTFGTTSGGLVAKELLPANYSFRMTSEYVPVDKAQNISANSTVGFSTVLCTVRVRNTQNQPVDNAIVSYYSGGWRQIGPTVNGEITKELLPGNLTFRISYAGTTQDKVQNLSASALVEFVVQ